MSAMAKRWARSGTRAVIRGAILHVLATIDRKPPRGVVNLFFHAVPQEQATDFDEFLERLLRMGRVIPMDAALTRSDQSEPAFTISFDDGFKSTFDVAGPILSRRGIPSTIFVATEFVGLSGAPLESFTHDRLNWPHVQAPMTAEDVSACAALGMQIGSHGVTHKSFAGMTDAEAADELGESKATLEKMSGQSVRYFAWPFGTMSEFPPRYITAALACGYQAVYSGVSRLSSDLPLVQPRRELNLSWGVRICAYLARRG